MDQNKRDEPVFRGLSDYADALQRRLNRSHKRQSISSKLLSIDSNLSFQTLVTQLENSEAFGNLFSQIQVAFLGSEGTNQCNSLAHTRLKRALIHFLRRSKFYLDLRTDEKVDISKYCKMLRAGIPRTKVKTNRFRLLNGVIFPENEIKFKTFSIRKFNRSELNDFFHNEVNAVFYPYAQVDTDLLSQFWFIHEEFTEDWETGFGPNKRANLDGIIPGLTVRDLVPRKLPDQILQMLSLYDWRPYFDPEFNLGFFGFTVPYTLTVDDCLFSAPRANRVDPTRLSWTVQQYADTNEEVEVPEFAFEIDREHLLQFRKSIQSVETFLKSGNLQSYGWEFFEVAFGHLAKAFFAEDSFEQLLWHIVALEALFSEENKSVVSGIKDRVAKVLGNTKAEKKELRKTFESLYDFRSILVHGKKYERKVDAKHLTAARDLARRSIEWCLESLNSICLAYEKKQIPVEQYPTRAELLAAIDASKDSRSRIRLLLENLPSNLDR